MRKERLPEWSAIAATLDLPPQDRPRAVRIWRPRSFARGRPDAGFEQVYEEEVIFDPALGVPSGLSTGGFAYGAFAGTLAMSIVMAVCLLVPIVVLIQSLELPVLLHGCLSLTSIAFVMIVVRKVLHSGRAMADRRAPVVLLRSHRDDQLKIDAGLYHPPFQRQGGLFGLVPLSFEEVLEAELESVGSLVALTLPGEQYKLFRFHRRLASMEHWQRTIVGFIFQAVRIVIILGDSKRMADERFGLAWEIATVDALCAWNKTIVVIPPLEPNEVHERWLAMRRLLLRLGFVDPPQSVPLTASYFLIDEKRVSFVGCGRSNAEQYVTALRRFASHGRFSSVDANLSSTFTGVCKLD